MPEPIVVEQEYDASPERLWRAITDQDEMVQWYFSELADFKPVVGRFFDRQDQLPPYVIATPKRPGESDQQATGCEQPEAGILGKSFHDIGMSVYDENRRLR